MSSFDWISVRRRNFFNLEQSAFEALQLVVEAYGDVALSGFISLRTVHFDAEDKKHMIRLKVFEDLEAFLEEGQT